MTVGERIKTIRGNMAREKFAPLTGISKTTLVNYETGLSSPTADYLNKLLELFPEYSPGWVLAEYGPMKRDEQRRDPRDTTPFYASAEELEGEFVMVPRYNVRASAGGGAVVSSEQVVDYLAFRTDWIKVSLGVPKESLALISVIGDSMEPTLTHGDLVLIDLRTTSFQDNGIYALSLNNALLVKRIQKKIGGTVIVKSDNPMYEPDVIGAEQMDALGIIGKVVWSGRRM